VKGAEIEVGGEYVAKVSGRLVALRVESFDDDPRTGRRRWRCASLATGREVSVWSAQRFRGRALPPALPSPAPYASLHECGNAEAASTIAALRAARGSVGEAH
jgi:hypothetical protein